MAHKNKRDITLNTNNIISHVILSVGVALLICSIGYFYTGSVQMAIGYHSFDMGQNFEYLLYDLDKYEHLDNYCDITHGGDCVPLTEMYKKGVSHCIVGYENLVIGFVLAVFGLGVFLALFFGLLIEQGTRNRIIRG